VTCTSRRGRDESRSCWTTLVEQMLLEGGRNLVADERGDRHKCRSFQFSDMYIVGLCWTM
jgi:hypothetical protein